MSNHSDLLADMSRRVGALSARRTTQEGRARLAQMRRNQDLSDVSMDILARELDGFPEHLSGRNGYLSNAEKSAYLALTLYAQHQQSNVAAMHSVDKANARLTLGGAVATLPNRESAQRRMVAALRPGAGDAEIARHLSSVVARLRDPGANRPLDYGQFALDLFDIFNGRSDRVGIRWHHAAAKATRKPNTELSEGN